MATASAHDCFAQVLQLPVPDDLNGVGRTLGVEGIAERDVLLGHRLEGDEGLLVLPAHRAVHAIAADPEGDAHDRVNLGEELPFALHREP